MHGEPLDADRRGCSRRCSCPRRSRAWSCSSTSARRAAQIVFVVDEYGEVQGMITVRDVLEAITGEFSTPTDEDAWAVQRDDGSWLFDGLIPMPELKDRLGLKELPEEDRGRYNTLAGMIMLLLGRLPQTADSVEWEGWRFEVVDLDGKRVDKVLATALAAHPTTEKTLDRIRALPPSPSCSTRSSIAIARRSRSSPTGASPREIHMASSRRSSSRRRRSTSRSCSCRAARRTRGPPAGVADRAARPAAAGENLYVNGAQWTRATSRRSSAAIRSSARRCGELDRPGVFVDAAWSGFSEAPASRCSRPATSRRRRSSAMEFLERFELESARTMAFCARLLDLDLLKDMRPTSAARRRQARRRGLPGDRRGQAAATCRRADVVELHRRACSC